MPPKSAVKKDRDAKPLYSAKKHGQTENKNENAAQKEEEQPKPDLENGPVSEFPPIRDVVGPENPNEVQENTEYRKQHYQKTYDEMMSKLEKQNPISHVRLAQDVILDERHVKRVTYANKKEYVSEFVEKPPTVFFSEHPFLFEEMKKEATTWVWRSSKIREGGNSEAIGEVIFDFTNSKTFHSLKSEFDLGTNTFQNNYTQISSLVVSKSRLEFKSEKRRKTALQLMTLACKMHMTAGEEENNHTVWQVAFGTKMPDLLQTVYDQPTVEVQINRDFYNQFVVDAVRYIRSLDLQSSFSEYTFVTRLNDMYHGNNVDCKILYNIMGELVQGMKSVLQNKIRTDERILVMQEKMSDTKLTDAQIAKKLQAYKTAEKDKIRYSTKVKALKKTLMQTIIANNKGASDTRLEILYQNKLRQDAAEIEEQTQAALQILRDKNSKR